MAFTPRPVDQIPDSEKIAAFDRLYNDAAQQLQNHLTGKTHCDERDNEYFTWEAVMQLLGPGVWDAWNSK